MDNLKPLKSFLTDLITPIVKSAVGEAIPNTIKEKDRNLVPVKKVTELYGISQTQVYRLFESGELEKVKQGWLTFVDTYQLEGLMRVQRLTYKAPMKGKKDNRSSAK